jgi:hypothetical protein
MGAPTTERSKDAKVISLLTGQAFEWERREEELDSNEGFMALFRGVFDHPSEGRDGCEHLRDLWQEDQTPAEYTLTFRTVAASSGWNEPALRTLLRRGLREEM